MSRIYSGNHRDLQDKFDSRKLADRVEEITLKTEFAPEHAAFIEAQDMFFLSSIDDMGRPTVSYKGGAPGFVRVLDEQTLAFPSYDGNGMFYSMGNIKGQPKIGMLFINFETPHRIRVQGDATVHLDDPLKEIYKEADLIIRVKLTEVWNNCPRYIHKYQNKEQSGYVPEDNKDTPIAGWKRIDLMQDVLPKRDKGRPESEGGIISIDEWKDDLANGKG